jgi:hypothetical protein
MNPKEKQTEQDDILDMQTEWDYYSGLPNPKAYEDNECIS